MGPLLDRLRHAAASTGTGTLTVTIEELNAVYYAHSAALRRAKAEGWREASEIAWNGKGVLAVYDECRARAAQIEEGE